MEEIRQASWVSVRNNFRGIYILTIVILILGILLDFINGDLYQPTYLLDFVTLAIWVISLILLLTKACLPSICFGIAAYVLCFNILATFLINPEEPNLLLHFYRNTVFYAFILTLTAYFVNKYHSFVMAGIYFIFLVVFSLYFNIKLLENSLTVMFSIAAYSFIIFYFVRMQERTLSELNSTNNRIISQNEELMQQQEEIIAQRDILERQKDLIESRNIEIWEGIRFAKSIQESVLSKESDIAKYFSKYFVLSKPKDLISGDFFWVKEWKGYLYLSLVDCTGHGVPGALVSMLANMYLGRAFIELENPDPAKILSYIRNAIEKELRLVDSIHARVGMDIACVRIDFRSMKMDYAAAFSPLYMIRRDNLTEYEATRLIMGVSSDEKAYRNLTLEIKKGDRFYLSSDGITDQFGGARDKKFGYKRFRNALLDTNHKDMEVQKKLFLKKWFDWKSEQFQIDDALLIGFEI
jgi:serine phosphatase RsbU (regulator of sigma subunit)